MTSPMRKCGRAMRPSAERVPPAWAQATTPTTIRKSDARKDNVNRIAFADTRGQRSRTDTSRSALANNSGTSEPTMMIGRAVSRCPAPRRIIDRQAIEQRGGAPDQAQDDQRDQSRCRNCGQGLAPRRDCDQDAGPGCDDHGQEGEQAPNLIEFPDAGLFHRHGKRAIEYSGNNESQPVQHLVTFPACRAAIGPFSVYARPQRPCGPGRRFRLLCGPAETRCWCRQPGCRPPPRPWRECARLTLPSTWIGILHCRSAR